MYGEKEHMPHLRRRKAQYGKKLSALMAAVMLTAAACGNGADDAPNLSTQISEGNGTGQDGAPSASPEASAVPTAEPTSERKADSTPAPDAASAAGSEQETEDTTTYGELSSIGTYAPAEVYSDRALAAVKSEEGIFVSWRCYEADSAEITFTLERNGEVVYTGNRTSYLDSAGKAGDTYQLTASEGISAKGETTKAWADVYQELTLQAPEAQTMPDGEVAEYTSNDMSVGDLDGDGQLELIVKWYPSNAHDNAHDGYTGTTILDAYNIDLGEGTASLMWRIDLGLNIRSGAHYTQFQVWDYDGDGKAELICKTADGSTTFDANLQETGHVGEVSVKDLPTEVKGKPEGYDFRQHTGRLGRIVLGQEYLTVFNGETGEIMDTVKYIPERGPYDEEKGIYDTRYYGRSALTAWKFIDG